VIPNRPGFLLFGYFRLGVSLILGLAVIDGNDSGNAGINSRFPVGLSLGFRFRVNGLAVDHALSLGSAGRINPPGRKMPAAIGDR
jgi:hypothetical protein